jgi:glycosyltransferase involved in cell wall biosynthesis
VIPCRDQARFLPAAIESVLAQSYQHFEIVVIDDGSDDNTEAVVRRYPGVQYVRQEHGGVSAARNAGLRLSTGGYLVFLDADDRLLPNALLTGLRQLAAHPECAFVSGHCVMTGYDGLPLDSDGQERVERDHYRAFLRHNYVRSLGTVMFRRAVFEHVGSFDQQLIACEDYDLYLRITRDFSVFCHGEPVAEYRKYVANTTGDPARMLGAALTVLRRHRPALNADRETRQAFRTGVRHSKSVLGPWLSRDIRQDLATPGRRSRGVARLTVLMRLYPRGLMTILAPRKPGRVTSSRRQRDDAGTPPIVPSVRSEE